MLPTILLSWALMLTAWAIWLIRKRPHSPRRIFPFRYCKFQIEMKRKPWK